MLESLKQIKALVFDCDGVMTDGLVQVTDEGTSLRTFNIKDGFAVQHAVKQGYPIAIISGGNHPGITTRFSALGVKDIYLAQEHKEIAFKDFCDKYSLKPNEVCYMGDDMPDLPLLAICGLSCCPKDAAADVLSLSKFISTKNGGKGCAREIIEIIMKAQLKWFTKNVHSY